MKGNLEKQQTDYFNNLHNNKVKPHLSDEKEIAIDN